MKVPLPPSIVSAIPTIRWPLGPSSSPPLCFQPLDQMSEIRAKAREHRISSPIDDIVRDIPSAISTLTPTDATSDTQHHSTLSIALLLLGHGYTDEAHDLITPISWPEETHFGYGPVVYSAASPAVVSLATCAHSLVHRREAFHVGEFGMVGFRNANYWSNAAIRSRGVDTLPHGRIRRAVLDVARGKALAEEWCQRRIIDEGGGGGGPVDDEEYFESRALHELCGNVMRNYDSTPVELREFAEEAAEAELRVLLGHALRGAGYDCGDCPRQEKGVGEKASSVRSSKN